MNKVATWTGETSGHGFRAEVSHDPSVGQYTANIAVHSPPAPQQHVAGAEDPTFKFEAPEKLVHTDLDKLRDLVKQHIESRFGPIKIFDVILGIKESS